MSAVPDAPKKVRDLYAAARTPLDTAWLNYELGVGLRRLNLLSEGELQQLSDQLSAEQAKATPRRGTPVFLRFLEGREQ